MAVGAWRTAVACATVATTCLLVAWTTGRPGLVPGMLLADWLPGMMADWIAAGTLITDVGSATT